MAVLARDIALAKVITVEPTLAASDLERLFERERISGVPVVENGRLVGVVSRADIARAIATAEDEARALLDYYGEIAGASSSSDERARLAGQNIESFCVRDLMSNRLVTVPPEQAVREVAQALTKHRIHRVLVAADGRLIGVISSLDLVQLIADGRLK